MLVHDVACAHTAVAQCHRKVHGYTCEWEGNAADDCEGGDGDDDRDGVDGDGCHNTDGEHGGAYEH
eukprot:12140156-Alexandrium_andersonii.AAC.1